MHIHRKTCTDTPWTEQLDPLALNYTPKIVLSTEKCMCVCVCVCSHVTCEAEQGASLGKTGEHGAPGMYSMCDESALGSSSSIQRI